MNQAIIVTEAAQKRLKELTQQKPDAIGVRVEVLSGGCSGFKYKFDYLYEKVDTDIISEYDNIVVAIDNKSCTLMFGTELDYVEDNFGSKFVFNNPQSKASCGCGKSFGV